MRTLRLFLGIFALALLLPLLLLACGGSDEPTDGPSSERSTDEPTNLPDSERSTDEPTNLPDSERSTDEPTNLPDSERSTAEPAGRASSGQTTPAPPTESAEPSPTPRATAALPMAQTSPETDREALVALYNATDGPNWNSNNNWLSDVLISEWEGVTTDDNGRVTGLSLFNNQLSGEIPPELGNLANLTRLLLGENRLSGCVPSSLSCRLYMDESDLSSLPFCPTATADATMAQTPPRNGSGSSRRAL